MSKIDQRVRRHNARKAYRVYNLRTNIVRKEMKAKSTNCWTLGYIKTYWEDSIEASPNPEHVAGRNVFHVSMLRKCNLDAR